MGSQTGAERAGKGPGCRPGRWSLVSRRSAIVTSQSRPGLAPSAPIMACWQRNRQFTQPPAAARRWRMDMKAANASTATVAATAVAVSTAVSTAAVPKKWLARPANITQATTTMAASRLAGRA